MAGADEMKRYWDARADEDPFYFVDNRLAYGDPDVEAFWRGGDELLERILGMLEVEIEADDEIVDIGCGVGRMTRVLAARGASVRAIDVSERMLELAREHNANLDGVEWLLGDGHSLKPIADASADVCHSHVVFQHIPDPEVTLGYVREIGRVLRAGGWAAFQVSNAPTVHRRSAGLARLRGLLASLVGRAPRGQSHPAWRGSAVDLDEVRRVAEEAGMEVERVVGAGTQFCFVLVRRRSGAASATR
ncbi:MAG: class I SAM-dependent methyltransferase [Solirubrobacterales bacterium]